MKGLCIVASYSYIVIIQQSSELCVVSFFGIGGRPGLLADPCTSVHISSTKPQYPNNQLCSLLDLGYGEHGMA
jgi:hypothetical protein